MNKLSRGTIELLQLKFSSIDYSASEFTDVKNTRKYFNADEANWYIKWSKRSLADVVKYAKVYLAVFKI